MKKIKIKLIASRLGAYYQRLCGRGLIYDAVGTKDKKALGWPIPEETKDTTHILAGNKWERIVLERLLEEQTSSPEKIKVFLCEDNDNKKYTYEQTLELLRNLDKKYSCIYIYQGCVQTTKSFVSYYLSDYDNKNFEIEFSVMYPDFLQIEYNAAVEKFKITVVDVKNADHVKINAQVQISLYATMIEAILKDNGIENCYVSEEGIVWNKEIITQNMLANAFDTKDAKKELDTFFSKTIREICERVDKQSILESLPCKFTAQCDYCGNFSFCLENLKKKRSARLLPYLSEEAQDRLDELIAAGELRDDSMDVVRELLESDDSMKLTDGCRYWKNVRNHLHAYCDALEAICQNELKKFPKKTSTLSFPKWEDYGITMTAQRDPDSGRIFAYAYNVSTRKGVDLFHIGLEENGYPDRSRGRGLLYDEFIAKNNSAAEFDRIDAAFVEAIYNVLLHIHEHEDQNNKKLQFYVMDSYERFNIENQLFYMLENLDSDENQELLFKVMTIIFWMQGERMVTDSDTQPKDVVENPVSDLVGAISQLYVISCPTRYRLIEVSKVFSENYNFYDDREYNEYYFEQLSDVLNGLSIYNIWNTADSEEDKNGGSKKETMLRGLQIHLNKRMRVEQNIVQAIQLDASAGNVHITATAAEYKMQKPKFVEYPEVAKLYFENRLEELIKYHQIRSVRTKGIDNAIAEGTILRLKWISDDKFEILNRDSYIGRDWFVYWICEDTPFNRAQLMLLDEKKFYRACRNANCKSVKDPDNENTWISVFHIAAMENKEGKRNKIEIYDDGNQATFNFYTDSEAFHPDREKRYLLFEVYRDFNSSKVDGGLEKLTENLDLLDPFRLSCNSGMEWNENSKAECSKYWGMDGKGFSSSQEKAFIHLFNRKLTVLVGPPAAGKTDFIGRSVITLAGYYKKVHGKNLKVLVSANSHSAIENILIKILKMKFLAKENAIPIPEFSVFKTGDIEDSSALLRKNAKVIGFNKYYDTITDMFADNMDKIVILGGTAWSLAGKDKIHKKDGKFDLIIIDEASQVRCMDAFLQLECLKSDGRILLVGDDDQLPPIIGGKYKVTPGEKYIHGSIFRMYITALQKAYDERYGNESHDFIRHPDIDIVTLEDNFRMNNILCRHSAEKIYKDYGMDYKARIERIATQTIRLRSQSGDELLDFMLDKEYPLVFCKLSGTASNQKNAEIDIVTKLVKELVGKLQNEDGSLAKDVGNFWDEKVADDKVYDGACGIISPHHEHINRLKTNIINALSEESDEIKNVFIGTVDKLQGRERTAVIVSYGVNDKETVKNEAEFIFSRNRFNVSITRGKAKTIVLLSDVIAESSIYTNMMKSESDSISEGIEFVQGFEEFMGNAASDEDMKKHIFEYFGGNVKLTVYKKRIQ